MYEFISRLIAAPIERSKVLTCEACKFQFNGCEDVFDCPNCGCDCDYWDDDCEIEKMIRHANNINMKNT